MESKTTGSKDDLENQFHDLIAKDAIGTMEDEIKVDDVEEPSEFKDRSSKLVIAPDDDIPKVDFFEAQGEDKASTYGEIKGMELVADEEGKEEGDLESANIEQAKHLSFIAKSFAESTAGTEEADKDDVSQRQSVQSYKMNSLLEGITIADAYEKPSKKKDHLKDDAVLGDLKLESVPAFIKPSQELLGAATAEGRTGRSIFYNVEGRIGDVEDDMSELFDFSKPEDIVLIDEHAENIEEESQPSHVEEEEPPLDRTPYYEKYQKLSEENHYNRVKNNILQKVVIMYLRRRKVEHFLKESEPPLDQLIKYGQKLDAYEELMNIDRIQRKKNTLELQVLKTRKKDKQAELNKQFRILLNREESIGYGLIYSKTGKPIPDKLVERLIKRQIHQVEQVSAMRLKYIKLKGMVEEKLEAIDNLETIENNLHLADYDQLKSENRSLADKIEEKDEELTRLRVKCQDTIQILAHLREKTSALDTDVFDLRDEYYNVESQSKDIRENLAYLKSSRDKYRQLARKLKDESGLLTKPELLRDMADSMNECKCLEVELKKCKHDVVLRTEEVRKLRENIEMATELSRIRKRTSKVDSGAKSKTSCKLSRPGKNTIYRGRPTLYMPTIGQNAFDDLIKIRATPTIPTKKRYSRQEK